MIRRPISTIPAKGPPRVSARQRVLAQWRGVNAAPMEIELRSTSKAVGALLPLVMKDLRLDQRAAENQLIKIWNDSLDPAITAHAQPAGIVKGTLFVVVDNHSWLSEIVRWRRADILKRMQAAVGSEMVQKISYRVG